MASSTCRPWSDPPITITRLTTTLLVRRRSAPAERLHGRVPGRAHAVTAEHLRHRLGQDLDVESGRAVVDVPDVERELLVPRDRVAAVHLRPPGDARAHLVAARLLGGVERQVLHEQRARAHQAHVAVHHVEQLGQLVDARAAQPLPERGEAFGVGQERAVGAAPVGHGAELRHHERPSAASRPLLAEQHRRPHAHAHEERDDREQRRQHHERGRRTDDVDDALQRVVTAHGTSRPWRAARRAARSGRRRGTAPAAGWSRPASASRRRRASRCARR